MDTEGMLIKLFQSLYLLCQCFNSTCFERLFYHLSCIQLSLRRWMHSLYLSLLFWLAVYMGLSMAKQNELLQMADVLRATKKPLSNSSFRGV